MCKFQDTANAEATTSDRWRCVVYATHVPGGDMTLHLLINSEQKNAQHFFPNTWYVFLGSSLTVRKLINFCQKSKYKINVGSGHSGLQLSHTWLGFQPNHCDNQKCLHKFKIFIPVGSIAPVAITSIELAEDKQTYFGGSQNFKLLESKPLVYGVQGTAVDVGSCC